MKLLASILIDPLNGSLRARTAGVAISLAIALIFLASTAFAECFDEAETDRITMQLEETAKLRERVDLLEKGTAELLSQIQALQQINALQKEQISQVKELMQIQKDGYESIIKSNKPNWFKETMQHIGFVGIGVLLGIALLL